jgi:biopolymer transport protein ExbD
MRIRSKQAETSDVIDISSMIDVMFILIIFFLVTTTFKEEEVDQNVKLPVDARNQSLTQTAGNVVKINIRQNGSYVLMGKQVTEEEIGSWLKEELKKKPDLRVVIRCDKEAKHLYLANVMSICVYAGVNEANIAVTPEKS